MTTLEPAQAAMRAHERLDRLARAQLADQVTDREWCQAILRDALSMRAHGQARCAHGLVTLVGTYWASVCAKQQAATS